MATDYEQQEPDLNNNQNRDIFENSVYGKENHDSQPSQAENEDKFEKLPVKGEGSPKQQFLRRSLNDARAMTSPYQEVLMLKDGQSKSRGKGERKQRSSKRMSGEMAMGGEQAEGSVDAERPAESGYPHETSLSCGMPQYASHGAAPNSSSIPDPS